MMTLKDLTALSAKDLAKELEKARYNLYKIKLEVQSGQSKNTSLIGKRKKYVSQILTLQNSQQSITIETPEATEATK